jgi:hypothetical protein
VHGLLPGIDVNPINKAVMRGLSVPTAINLPNPVRAGIQGDGQALPVQRRRSEEAAGRAGY